MPESGIHPARFALAVFALLFAASCLEPVGPVNFSRTPVAPPGSLDDGLYVIKAPDKLEYGRGDELLTDGMEVAFSNLGVVRFLAEGDYTLSWDGGELENITSEFGEKEITVSYEGYAAAFTIDVKPEGMEDGLFITSPPANTDYELGYKGTVTTAGMVAVFLDGGEAAVIGENDYTLGPDGGMLGNLTGEFGNKTITVSYGGHSASFQIYVKPDVPEERIGITSYPDRLEYEKDDSLELKGIEVTRFTKSGPHILAAGDLKYKWVRRDGSGEPDIADGNSDVTGEIGTQKIRVIYGEFDTVFQIAVPSSEFPSGLIMVSPPDNQIYERLRPFDRTGLSLKYFEDGLVVNVPLDNVQLLDNYPNGSPIIEGGDSGITAEIGAKKIYAVYSGSAVSFNISVVPNSGPDGGGINTNGLVVASLPDKWEYPAGDTVETNRFRGEGLAVMLYSAGWARDVTKEVNYFLDGGTPEKYDRFAPKLGNREGPVTVNVKYGAETTSFRVYVRTDIFHVYNSTTWDAALAAITENTGSAYTIYIVPDPVTGDANPVEISPPANGAPLFPNRFGLSVTLSTLPGKPMTLQITEHGTDSRGTLQVGPKQMLIIDGQDAVNEDGDPVSGTLTVRGKSGWANGTPDPANPSGIDPDWANDKALFTVKGNGAYLELRNGIIRDNCNISQTIASNIDAFNKQLFGGGVAVYDGGFFLMNGGEITGCRSLFGAAIYINDMQGGAQIWNPAGERFAAEIKAGKIRGNACPFQNGWGGPAGEYPGWFMRKSSGIVFVTNGRMLMSGGEISDNTSNGAYGAVYLFANSSLYMLNGIIYGDDAKAGTDTVLQGEEKANKVSVPGKGEEYQSSLGRGADGGYSFQNSNMGRAYAVKRVGSSYVPSTNANGTDDKWGRKVFNDGNDYDYEFGRQVFRGMKNVTMWMENGVIKSPVAP